jgi:hypothetical protein
MVRREIRVLVAFGLLFVPACSGGGGGGGSSGSGELSLVRASNGFGQLLPHQVVDTSTQKVVAIRTQRDLIDHVTAANPIRPVTPWPTAAQLPSGASGNHYVYVEFDRAIDVEVVLSNAPGTGGGGLLGPLTVVSVDPGAPWQSTPVAGRAFIGGRSYHGPDPANPPNLALQQLVQLNQAGQLVAAPVGGETPGLGFPGTESAAGFPDATVLVSDRTLVFVADSDDDLSTHEAFPAGRQILLRATTALSGANGGVLRNRVLAAATVGTDDLPPEALVTPPPTASPISIPSFAETGVDPETSITLEFTEPLQPFSVGSLPGGAPPNPSSSIEVKFGPALQRTSVPFTVLPPSVYDLSRWELTMAFAFPGSGPVAAGCSTFATIDITVHPNQLVDLAAQPNDNQLAADTFFTTGEGPGLVNAPVSPDAIYVGRMGTPGGVSVIDLNGFGAGTGDPGRSNFPNNPNLGHMPNLFPPLVPGTCTVDGGSAGAFTLTTDSSLDDLVLRPPLVSGVGDMMIGAALDLVYHNSSEATGCRSDPGNICALTGKKRILGVVVGKTIVPGTPPNVVVAGGANLISWAPHPNPPPLVFPPLCIQPFIGGQEPTSIASLASGLTNLLPANGNALGDPLNGIPPSGLLAENQNAFFVGPDLPSNPNIGSCLDYMIRQQIGHFLYIVDPQRREVVVVNSNRFTVLDRIPLSDPTKLAMSPNLDMLAVTNRKAGNVSFIDIDPRSSSFHQVVATTSVGAGPRGIAWDPGNEDILVCNEDEGSVSILSAFSFQVRKVVQGSLSRPFDIAITQRQTNHGFGRNVYFAWILNRNGDLALFESGPSGVNGWGYDDVVGVTPFTFQSPKRIAPDLENLNGAVYVLHENQLNPDGSQSGLAGGAVSRVRIDSASFGQLPLTGSILNPQFRDMGFSVDVSIGPAQLTGIPVDIAFDDLNNLGALVNATHPSFSASPSVPINGKAGVKTLAGVYGAPKSSRYLFLAVPSSTEGPGVVDVIDLRAGFLRTDTDARLPGVQSIPAPGCNMVVDYWRQ